MKLVKALGALALFGTAIGTAQLAAAETTTPIQDLVLVEETTSSALADARRPPDDIPYHGPYRPYRPYRPYGHFQPFRPYRPYGHFQPFRPFHPYGHYHGGRSSEATPRRDLPMPLVSLADHR
ncbi:hypothetical protein WME94_41720 [Sorangium sp. So ce429]